MFRKGTENHSGKIVCLQILPESMEMRFVYLAICAYRRSEEFQKQEENIRKSHQILRGLRREVRLEKDKFDELKKEHDENLNSRDETDHALRLALQHKEQTSNIRLALEKHKSTWMANIKVR